jgi:hypothetical protein
MFLTARLDPKTARPRAILLLVAGLLLLCCATSWQHVMTPLLGLSAEHDDFAHGFCLGLALTLELIAVILLVRIGRQRQQS